MFEEVFKPLEVRGVTIPNRIVFPACLTNYATEDGFVTERLENFHRELVRGGSGLIVVGCFAVSKESVGATNVLQLTDDKHIGGVKELFQEIKSNGTVVAAQLIHFGRQTVSVITGHPLVAASAIPCPMMKEMPRELTEEEILRIEDDFAAAALRAKKAGADIVEIHAAYGYLLSGFLSPVSNKRTDKYGGSLENRTRIVREVIAKVRSRVGDMPICCRITADEFVEGGVTLTESKKIAQMLVDAGADMISVGGGVYQSFNQMLPTKEMGEGLHLHLATGIKEAVDVPVICNGNILNLGFAQKILEEGKTDLVAICRPLVADPQLVNKSKNGEPETIVECDLCNHCAFFLVGEPAMTCPKNPNL